MDNWADQIFPHLCYCLLVDYMGTLATSHNVQVQVYWCIFMTVTNKTNIIKNIHSHIGFGDFCLGFHVYASTQPSWFFSSSFFCARHKKKHCCRFFALLLRYSFKNNKNNYIISVNFQYFLSSHSFQTVRWFTNRQRDRNQKIYIHILAHSIPSFISEMLEVKWKVTQRRTTHVIILLLIALKYEKKIIISHNIVNVYACLYKTVTIIN